ncbi:MAG: hypothetical protein ABII10_02305 [Candidatus Paceibacterota bacterium]
MALRPDTEPRSNQEKKMPQSISIPGPIQEVDISRVQGDYLSGISFELNVAKVKKEVERYEGQERHQNWIKQQKELIAFLEAKGRIFITQNATYLFVAPEGGDIKFPFQ